MTRIIVLSPHLDDAALSCGGLIAALSERNDVEIWTIFSGAPFNGPYSPNALWLHGISGATSGRQLSRVRRNEDIAACNILNATCRHLGFWDSPYRKNDDGAFLYDDLRVEKAAPDEERLILRIASSIKARLQTTDVILAPLGVGGHVDHVIAHRVGTLLPQSNVVYYVDLPYAKHYPEEVLSHIVGLLGFDYSLEQRHKSAWRGAVNCYKSQLRMLHEEAGAGLADFIQSAYADGLCRLYTSSFETIERVFRRVRKHGVKAAALAPIAIFAFNRLDLLQKTVDALEDSDGFSFSPIYVFSEAARADRPGEAKEVERVREWIDVWAEKTGATVVKAESNQGLRRSIISGVARVLQEHDTVIVLEDDIVVAPSFVAFMNDALEANKNRTDIFQISGYFVPHEENLAAAGLVRAPGSWGWATWRRAWEHYQDDAQLLLDEVRKCDTHAFDMDGTYAYVEALEKNATGELDTWSVRWYASIFLLGGLVVYPGMSLARNIGFGGRATNTNSGPTSKAFLKQPIDSGTPVVDWAELGHKESPAFAKALADFYRWQHAQWVKPSWRDRIVARLQVATGRPARA